MIGGLGWIAVGLALAQTPATGDATAAQAEAAPVEAAPPAVHHPPVVFIHGLYLNGASWAAWENWFQGRGWTTSAPDWPGHSGAPSALRQDPPDELRKLNFKKLLDFWRTKIVAMPEKPVVIGHSMGGLIAQILLAEGRVRAAVAIHPAPPKGVLTFEPVFYRSNSPILQPGRQPIVLKQTQFAFGFANDQDELSANAAHDQYVVAESRRVARGPLTPWAKIDFKAPHDPLLIIAGRKDHTVTQKLNEKNARKYKDPNSVTELLVMDRAHNTCQAPGWLEVAEAAEAFLLKAAP